MQPGETQLDEEAVVVHPSDVEEVPKVDEVDGVEGGEALLEPVPDAELAQPAMVVAGVELVAPAEDPPALPRKHVEVVGRPEVDRAEFDAKAGLDRRFDVAE